MNPNERIPQNGFDRLVRLIEVELEAQIAVHRLEAPDGLHATAELIADEIVRHLDWIGLQSN